jgi:hypothetical protein
VRPSRAILAGCLVLGLLSPLAARAAAPTPQTAPLQRATQPLRPVTGVVRPLSAYEATGLSLWQALRVRQLDALVAGGVPQSAIPLRAKPRPRPDPPGVCMVLGGAFLFYLETTFQPVGDLNGDGRPDVLQNYYADRTKTTYTWVLTARDARSGKPLWRKVRVLRMDSDTYESSFAMSVPLASGRPGVLVFYDRYDFSGSGLDVDLTSDQEVLDGRARRLWHQRQAGHVHEDFDGSMRLSHAPLGYWLANLRAGKRDLLVATYNGASGSGISGTLRKTALENGHTSLAVPVANGRPLTPALPVVGAVTLQNDGLPRFGTVADQNGDRRDDLVVAQLGDAAAMTVYGGTTGKQVWSQLISPLASAVQVVDAGVVSNGESRVHDLAVIQFERLNTLQLPLIALDALDGVVTLLVGGTGQVGWVRPGTMAYATGNATVAVGAPRTSTDLVSTTRTIDIVEYDALGEPRATHTHAITRATTGCGYSVTFLIAEADFDADRVKDPVIVNFMFDVTDVHFDMITLRGATGAELDRNTAWSTLSAVDGHGVDRAAVDQKGLRTTFEVRAGDTLKSLFTTSLSFSGRWYGGDVYALPITSRCADVVLFSFGSKGSTIAFLGSNGQPWWTISYAATDPYGRLTRGHKAAARC